jgi:small conductance mechanosensitive channel
MNNSINNFFENIKKTVSNKLPNFIGSLFIFIIFMIVAIIIRNSISGEIIDNIIEDESNIYSKTLVQHQIGNVVYYLILIVGVIFSIINLGFDTTAIITVLASFGLAIGIAMQGTLSNIISGIIISINNLYNINDLIRINQLLNENTIYGKVIDFNLYFTTVIDPRTKLIINIPNSTIQNNLLTNVSRSKLLFKK